MRVISETKLKKFWCNHPKSKVGLQYWYKLTCEHRWQSFNDVRQTFPAADYVKNFVIFNIGGNNFRLITYIDFDKGIVFIREVLTHGEYDKNKWKKDDWFQ